MLIQFTLKNFRSFRDEALFSLVASNYDKETRISENSLEIPKFNFRLVKSAVLYGANASGKSRFFEAVDFVKNEVINSFRNRQTGELIRVQPFALQSEFESSPCQFEVVFLQNGTIYRYGFEATKTEFTREWLYFKSNKKEVLVFKRDTEGKIYHPKHFVQGNVMESQHIVRKNALLLSSAAIFSNVIINDVISWFQKLQILHAQNEEHYEGYTHAQSKSGNYKKPLLDLLEAADLGIIDFSIKTRTFSDIPGGVPEEQKEQILSNIYTERNVFTKHKTYDNLKNVTGTKEFSMSDDESAGTKKFFALGGPIIDTLQKGGTLIVDELDSKLHPALVGKIANMFNSKLTNPNNAQLIFNTHNTGLLKSGLFRRDQIWFTEKDRYGASKLYSLSDIKVRKEADFESHYNQGRYGAVPYLAQFDELFINEPSAGEE